MSFEDHLSWSRSATSTKFSLLPPFLASFGCSLLLLAVLATLAGRLLLAAFFGVFGYFYATFWPLLDTVGYFWQSLARKFFGPIFQVLLVSCRFVCF